MKIINKIFYILLLISIIFFGYLLKTLDLVPDKYYLLIIGILSLLSLLVGICIFKIKLKVVQVLLLFTCLFLTIGFSYVDYELYRADNFITSVDKELKETISYYVLIDKDSQYKKITELNNKTFGTYSFHSDNYEEAYKLLKEKVTFKEKKYEDVTLFTKDLNNKKIEAIFINANNYIILKESLNGFEDEVKILYELKVELKNNIKETNQEDLLKQPFNIYISGIDTTGSIDNVSRSDVNIVMTINPNTHEIILTSIPRDYYVKLHDTYGLNDKLTHAGIYGVEMSKTTIEDLLDIEIKHHFRVNFTTFEKIIDAIGGIDVYSDQSFKEFGYSFEEGMNHLNGKEALMFARIRHVFSEGDRKRGEHQQEVIEAVIKKLSSSKTLLLSYADLLNNLKGTFQTSISSNTIKEFVKFQLDEMPSWNIKTVNLNGTGASRETYSMPGRLLYVMIPDEESVNSAKNYIKGVFDGKTIEEIETPVTIPQEDLNTKE